MPDLQSKQKKVILWRLGHLAIYYQKNQKNIYALNKAIVIVLKKKVVRLILKNPWLFVMILSFIHLKTSKDISQIYIIFYFILERFITFQDWNRVTAEGGLRKRVEFPTVFGVIPLVFSLPPEKATPGWSRHATGGSADLLQVMET